MRALFLVFSYSPLWLLHALGWLAGWLVFLLSSTYRRRLRANAAQAGLRWRSWLPAVGAAGQMVAELPRLWLGRAVPTRWDGAEQVQAALDAGKGIVFLTPHLGCFESTARAYAARFGSRQPVTVLYRPARQAWLAPLVQAARTRPGLQSAPTTLAGVKQLIKALKKGECVGLLPDQVPPQGQGVWSPFFGREAYTMTLSVRLAQQTGATVLLAWGERLRWGRGYVVHVRPLPVALTDDAAASVRAVNQAMESLIVQAPGQYLWAYARYKTPREAA